MVEVAESVPSAIWSRASAIRSATRQRPSAPRTTSGNSSADWVASVNDQRMVRAATRKASESTTPR